MSDGLLYRLHTPAGEIRAVNFELLRAAAALIDRPRRTPEDLLTAVTMEWLDLPSVADEDGEREYGAA